MEQESRKSPCSRVGFPRGESNGNPPRPRYMYLQSHAHLCKFLALRPIFDSDTELIYGTQTIL